MMMTRVSSAPPPRSACGLAHAEKPEEAEPRAQVGGISAAKNSDFRHRVIESSGELLADCYAVPRVRQLRCEGELCPAQI
jgi:hypothetical protein